MVTHYSSEKPGVPLKERGFLFNERFSFKALDADLASRQLDSHVRPDFAARSFDKAGPLTLSRVKRYSPKDECQEQALTPFSFAFNLSTYFTFTLSF